MEKNYGKVGWDDSGSQRQNKFAQLVNGPNKVRMISSAYKYLSHRVKFEGDKNKFGRNIKCAVNNCPLCKEGHPVKIKYIAAVLMSDEVKHLDMGTLLYNKIKGIKKHMEGYEDPRDYNINIVRDPTGGAQNFYQAFPMDKSPLTAKQMSIIEESFDESELENFCVPPEVSQLEMSIAKIKSFIKSNNEEDEEEERHSKKSSVVTDDDYEFTVKRT